MKMPVRKSQKVGEIHRVTYEKTFFDKVKEVVGGFFVFLIVIGILGAIVS